MQNNGNPKSMIQQIMSNATPEQKEILLKEAKGYGCPENILSQIQNMKQIIIVFMNIIINIFEERRKNK